METRRLGRTDHHSSVAILGGAAFFNATPDEAGAGLTLALDAGVNHLDIAPRYGEAEIVVGRHLPPVRGRMFIGGKTTRANADGVRAQLEQTLRRLGTDHLDLYQLHGVTSIEELDRRRDAVEVILAAREEGLCQFVGITGHDLTAPAAHHEALRRYDLDTVMFPVYPRVWADDAYRSDAEALLATCADNDVGVMAIKAVARRPWGDQQPDAGTWYEPYKDVDSIARGIGFALSTAGVHAFCTPGDQQLLPTVLQAAAAYASMNSDGRARAMADTGSDEIIFPLSEKAAIR